MHQTVVVSLSGILLLLCAESRAMELFAREPEIEIHCNNGVLAKGYSRLSRFFPSAVFTYALSAEPVPKEEWELKEPIIFWSMRPRPEGGRFVATDEKAELYLPPDTSFGVSYSINLLITWPLENKETGEIERESRSASYVVDAVEYSFKMRCLFGARASGGLLDNYPATVSVMAKGCTRDDLLDLSFSSRPNPKESGTPVNKAGTDMKFSKVSALEFRVEKTYWYGLDKPRCCYKYGFPYEVKLFERREGLVATEEVTVGWPDEHPEANVLVVHPEWQISITQNGSLYRAVVNLPQFERVPVPFDKDSVSDQYREETIKEEEYHIKQFMGTVSWEEGGEPDIFSVDKIYERLAERMNLVNEVVCSCKGESKSAFTERLRTEIKAAVDEEFEISMNVIKANLWYREMKAKAHAGYNAAWKYHCTYEDAAHLESEIKHKTRDGVAKGL